MIVRRIDLRALTDSPRSCLLRAMVGVVGCWLTLGGLGIGPVGRTPSCWAQEGPEREKAEEITSTKTVGPVTVNTTLTPASPTIGDDVKLAIEVISEKDVEVLMPEFQEALQQFTISEFVPRQNIASDGTTTQSQVYTLQPNLSGAQAIPPILVEFVDNRPGKQPTPDDFDAFEILTDRIDFTVESILPSEAASELKPPLGELEMMSEEKAGSYWWIFGILAAVAGLIAAVLFWQKGKVRSKRVNAYEVARRRLDDLIKDWSSEKRPTTDAFFVEITDIVRRYLEDRFELRAPELTTDEFLQLAAVEGNLTREHQRLMDEFLKQADLVKFAGVSASEQDVRHSSDLAVRFLEETRENAPDITVPVSPAEVPANA